VTCRTCFWWSNRECRKAAPITYPVVTRPGDCDRSARPVWPETQPEDFCGAYKASAAKLPTRYPRLPNEDRPRWTE
jgi:hypothetical protein